MLEIRCSKLARPMACAGSLFFTDLPPEEDKPAAMEGTAFGEYMRHLLEGTPVGTHATNGVAFDEDMKFYAMPLAEEILTNATEKVRCEQPIDWITRSGIWIRGSYDVAYERDGKLYVDDFKYGWRLVEVFENWQLLGYAIGEVIRRKRAYEQVVVRIHQPRPHHEDGSTREWVLSYNDLLSYKERIENRMLEIAGGDKTLVTGAHCKYCPAAGEACPAINKSFWHGIEMAHEFVQDQISDKALSYQLDVINRISEVVKIKHDSLKELAVNRIKNGRIVPGYITESSYGDRKWKQGISPEIVKALTGKDIIEKTMLSPAKAEKAGVPKEFVNSLVDRHFLGQKLVKKDASKVGDKIFGKGGSK